MRPHKTSQKDRRPKPSRGAGPQGQTRQPRHETSREKPENWIYGLHAVEAALANPRRKLHRAVLTARAAETL